MDRDSFIVSIKTDDSYKHIAEDVETRFNTSNYNQIGHCLKKKQKKAIELIKDELDGKIKFVELKAKTYIYLIDDGSKNIKAKDTKKVCHEKKS